MEELTRIRKGLGWSQQRLADESGVDKSTINQIEKGRRSPNIETLAKLAGAMGLEIGDLFPKAGASQSSSPELRRSALQPIVTAADVLVRGAEDPQLERDKAFGLMLAAQAFENQLSVFMGDLEAWGQLSRQDRLAVARLMGRLDAVIEAYNARMEGELRFTEIEREEAQKEARPEELMEKWKSATGA